MRRSRCFRGLLRPLCAYTWIAPPSSSVTLTLRLQRRQSSRIALRDRGELARDAVHDFRPCLALPLAMEPHRRIPRTILASEQPTPIRHPRQQQPDRLTDKKEPMRLVMQMQPNVLVAPGVKLVYDDKQPALALPFSRCIPNACFASGPMTSQESCARAPTPGRVELRLSVGTAFGAESRSSGLRSMICRRAAKGSRSDSAAFCAANLPLQSVILLALPRVSVQVRLLSVS
jgi:Invasion associated locus B (IalB) protein